MISRIYWWVSAACLLSNLYGACCLYASPAPNSAIVDDNAPGWIWNTAADYFDPALYGTSAHACGPGGYGAYTFNGVGVSVYVYEARSIAVDERQHKIGRLKLLIDGTVASLVAVTSTESIYDVEAVKVGGLKPGNHVLQVEADGGWVVIDYLRITSAAAPPDAEGSSADEAPSAANASRSQAISEPLGVLAYLPQGSYEILARSNLLESLDIPLNITDDGTQVQVYSINQSARQLNQRFQISEVNQNTYRISPMNLPSKALTYSTSSDGRSAPVIIWGYQPVPAEEWTILKVGQGTYRLTPASSPNLALSVNNGTVTDGVRVNLTAGTGSPSQLWVIKKD